MNAKVIFFEKIRWDIITGVLLALMCIYLMLISTFHEIAVDSDTDTAIAAYLSSPTQSHFESVTAALNECLKIDDWDCRRKFYQSETLSTLIAFKNIEQVIQSHIFDDERMFQLADEWVQYSGSSSIGLLRKAEALARSSNYSAAIPTYKLSFDAGKKIEVAKDLIHIYEYFGCKDDISIWSEFFNPKIDRYGPTLNPFGSRYPEQATQLSIEEVIDRRTRLRRNEFQYPLPSCPLSKF